MAPPIRTSPSSPSGSLSHQEASISLLSFLRGVLLGVCVGKVRKRKFSAALLLFSHSVVSDSFVTPWTVARQVPLSMGFSRQEDWSGLPFPSPGDLPSPGIEPVSPTLQTDSLPLRHLGSPCTLDFVYSLFVSFGFAPLRV